MKWIAIADDRFTQTRTQVIPNGSWLTDDSSMSWSQAGSGTTESVEAGEPMILLRLRRTQEVRMRTLGGAKRYTVNPTPTDGIMVWIKEPKKR